ncbi:hypothetical protein BDQ17DRAFT_1349967 [Cyathus striatus]|nr:hypothetical protein BDQ17DRAFT_1349967 [Cyathus striatus]
MGLPRQISNAVPSNQDRSIVPITLEGHFLLRFTQYGCGRDDQRAYQGQIIAVTTVLLDIMYLFYHGPVLARIVRVEPYKAAALPLYDRLQRCQQLVALMPIRPHHIPPTSRIHGSRMLVVVQMRPMDCIPRYYVLYTEDISNELFRLVCVRH